MPVLGLHVFFLSSVLGLESALSRGKEEIAEDIALWRTDALPDTDPVIRQAIVAPAGAEAVEQASFADLDKSMMLGALETLYKDAGKCSHIAGEGGWKAATTYGGMPAGQDPTYTKSVMTDPTDRKAFVPMFLQRCEELENMKFEDIAAFSREPPAHLQKNFAPDLVIKKAVEYLQNPRAVEVKRIEGIDNPVDLIANHLKFLCGKESISTLNYFVAPTADAGAGIALAGHGETTHRFAYNGRQDVAKDTADCYPCLTTGGILANANSDQRIAAAVELHYQFFYFQVFMPALRSA